MVSSSRIILTLLLGEMLKQVQHDNSRVIGVADSEDPGPHDTSGLKIDTDAEDS
jgi:hypothetical protein|tara:strand:- start:176184 stop:176345 length:162 start_codon:yes stop_codon:yes gene_type:complete